MKWQLTENCVKRNKNIYIMYPNKSCRIFTLDLACTLYHKCVFQHNMQYSVQIKLSVKMR